MSDLLAARAQMALSLGFHIVFAVAGMAMPLLMIMAEGWHLKTGDKEALDLAKRWAKGTAILFAVGAVSGTVLSFELGLLWPRFMEHAGPIIGLPFSLEGLAFFLEAIFLGLYLYGWDKLSPKVHWLTGFGVLAGGTASGAFVVCVNAWMNAPAGVTMEAGKIVDIRPWEAMLGPAAFTQVLHMLFAAFQSCAALVAAIHAFLLLRRPSRFHRAAFAIAGSVAAATSLAMPFTGHLLAQQVARTQPVKLAAMESHWETMAYAPMMGVPGALSLLAFNDRAAVVKGLNDVAPADRPPVAITRAAFLIMVSCGTLLAGVSALGLILAYRRRGVPDHPLFLKAAAACGPLGMLALEAGWTVTEVGRQPWIIQGIMRTKDAVTPMPGLQVPFLLFTGVYLLLSATTLLAMRSIVKETA